MRFEGELATVRAEILATGRGAASKTTRPRATKTRAEALEVVRETVRVLRDAGAPLPRREIAARLGLKPWVARIQARQGRPDEIRGEGRRWPLPGDQRRARVL